MALTTLVGRPALLVIDTVRVEGMSNVSDQAEEQQVFIGTYCKVPWRWRHDRIVMRRGGDITPSVDSGSQ